MQFQVPQFIEVEDKIFGPLTFKQFVYVIGAAGAAFIIYTFVENFYIKILLIAPISGFGLALAFIKVNERPFINYLESAIRFYFGNKIYIWRKDFNQPTEQETQSTVTNFDENKITGVIPKLTSGKLRDLTWSLDIHEMVSPVVDQKK